MQVLQGSKAGVMAKATSRPTARVITPVSPLLQLTQRSVIVRAEDNNQGSRTQQAVKDRLSQVQEQAQRVGGGGDGLPEYSPATSAFTRRREVFVGRLAMIGFIAGCTAEIMQAGHPNILVQVSNYLGGLPLGPRAVALIVGGIVAFNTVTALNPKSPTWSEENQKDVAQRPKGPPSDIVSATEPGYFFGLSGWGFTKQNEVLHGRLAMLGFAGTLLIQLLQGGPYGPGPLAQLAVFLNTTPSETFYAGIPPTFIAWSVLAIALAYLNNQPGQTSGRDDIY